MTAVKDWGRSLFLPSLRLTSPKSGSLGSSAAGVRRFDVRGWGSSGDGTVEELRIEGVRYGEGT